MHEIESLTLKETVADWGQFILQTVKSGFIDGYLHRRRDPHESMVEWSLSALNSVGVNLMVKGVEHISGDSPQIFMANHQSNFDIFIMTAALPVKFFWVYKHTLNSVPIMGSYLKRRGHISINRKDRPRAIESLQRAGELIRQGKNITVFPEGTRSGQRELLPFKKGVFHLAFEANVPVVPITINNSHELMRPGSLKLYRTDVEVTVHPPISLEGLHREHDFEKLREMVRETIERGLE